MRIFLGVAVTLILIIAIAAVIAGPSLGDWLPSMSSTPSGVKVRMLDVKPAPLVETVAAPGEISPFVKVNISAEVSARITDLPYREGERVKPGDVVVKLDSKQFQAALESATARRDGERFRLQAEQSRLAGPRSSLDNAKAVLARQESLFETGDVSKQALDDATARVRDLEATVAASQHTISVIESSLAAAEAEIQQANEALAKTTIRAPIDGMITVLNAEVGELVMVGTMNNAGTVILTIGDLSRIKLDAKVNEADIARVARDQRSQVRINAYRNEVFDGRVTKVPLQRTLDKDGTGYFRVEIEVQPKDSHQILSGLAANVDIEIAAHQGLALPSQAILDRPTDELPDDVTKGSSLVDRSRRTTSVVVKYVDGKAVLTPVSTGPSNLTDTLVVAGLKDGDVVVTGPYKSLEKLKHGDRLERESDAKKDAADTPAAAVAKADSGPKTDAPAAKP